MSVPTNEKFCGVCHHQLGVGTGHEENCPVYTGEPQRGFNLSDLSAAAQYLNQGAQNTLGQMGQPYEAPGSIPDLIVRMRLLCDRLEEEWKKESK